MVKRILFVDHTDGLGGAEHSLLLLMSHLNQAKWEPHLAGVNGRLLSQTHQLNIPIHPIVLPRLRRSPRFLLDWLDGARAIAAAARQINADFLHTNTIRAALYTSLAAKLVQRPFIWHMRDFWLSENKPARLWMDTAGKRALVASSRRVIVNSNAVARHLPASDKVHVIHNGIDTAQFNPQMNGVPFRQQYNIPLNTPLAGMVGRLRPWKGQANFLQMAKQVVARLPDAWFVIVGGAVFDDDDNYPQQLRQMSRSLGLDKRVVFTGQLQDVRPALAAFNIFVHPGNPEPFGLVNVEAMAMDKPVVAFAHGALPEIVVQGKTGILTPPGDIPALAEAVLALLQDDKQRRMMGENGRIRIQNHFTIQRVAQEVKTIYENLS
ncbi:MAG: glycosyltransferase family 4 protein [Chloroflexi bacterium]|nr:glycosyltransferase family 4 protein [Chloroflexota bacterium]